MPCIYCTFYTYLICITIDTVHICKNTGGNLMAILYCYYCIIKQLSIAQNLGIWFLNNFQILNSIQQFNITIYSSVQYKIKLQ